ncbi:glutamate-rich protein 3 isoform X4 [Herpailurus yagouaroundi]|uniref:glutamate-rich protein 3 isoform X4 n=1 Tax=Herpailurus yagouaroundi TaxID=1608482 RepID=UPI001AD6B502|nr:glutamate-rich protein 3 isoform X4 [Puma yagouaroundi]
MHHSGAALDFYYLSFSQHPALPSPGPSRKHRHLNVCVCVCVCVCVLYFQITDAWVLGDRAPRATEQGPRSPPTLGPLNRGWKTELHFQLPQAPFQQHSGLSRTSAFAFPPPLATARLWIPPVGGGPRRLRGSSGAVATQLRCPAHRRPQCGATPRARVSLRQRAPGAAHPTSAPAAGSKRDPAKMSHSQPAGLLAAYNSLTDKHLTGYFNNTRIRRHLLRSGLITRSGRILSEKEYKLNIMKRDHQKYIRECLAQAIFHKVLDMETAPRPYTAPGNMQPPIRLKPLPSNPAVGTAPKITSGSRLKTSLLENEAPFPIGGKKAVMKFKNSMDNSQEVNRYQLPNINNYMMPIPPSPPPHKGKITRENRLESWRRRRFRPTTAPNGLEPLFTRDSRKVHRTPLHSNAAITMIYLGKNVHLSHDHPDFRDEIKVYQQHCGGENLCVYKGKLLEKETFQFISKRHHGFPFSLTFFLNGMQVNRLSSCCEYKHRKGSRLGGKRGYFGFVCVERSSPCYKCIIAMGLDKNPTSPKPRKEKNIEKREELKKSEGKLRKDRGYMIPRRYEMAGSKTSPSVIFSAQEKIRNGEVRTAVEEMERKGDPGQDVCEDDQENIFKYEYEEDFEADEEKQDEKANEEGQADDQMNGMSKSPSDDEKDHLDPAKESETSWQKAADADDNVKDEGDGCSDSELEEEKQDIKPASSSSSRSHPCSSCSEDESTLGDREAHTENSPNKSSRSSSFQESSENDEAGKSCLPIEDSQEVEIEDQEIMTADVETKPLPIEECLENVLEEEMEKGTQVIAEGISEKSREHVSKEEKEKDKSKLWEGSTAKVKDKKAGPYRVEKGVGQIVAEAVEPGCHCHSDTEPGVSSTDEEEKHWRKPEIDTSAALNRNFVLEERVPLNSNKESNQVVSEVDTLEKKEAVEEAELAQHRDVDTIEGKGDAARWGTAGVNEVPLGEWKPTAEQPALVEEFTEERGIPQGITRGAEAEAEGDKRLGKEEVSPRGKEAAGASGGLHEGQDEAPEGGALLPTVLETEKVAAEEEQGSEKTVFASQAAAVNLECVQEAAAPREAVTAEMREAERGDAVSEAGPEKPDVMNSEEEASTEVEDLGAMEDAASEREDGSEEAVLGGEEPAKERKVVMGRQTPLSSSTSEKAEAPWMGVLEDSLEELCQEDAEREEVETEPESNKEDDRKEMLPKELGVAREKRKIERPEEPLEETESESREVRRANAHQGEDILEEEQNFKGEEQGTAKEVTPEEETQVPPVEMECDAEGEAPMGASESLGDTGPQGGDPLRETEVTMFEAAPADEKSLEDTTALRREEGGERLREAQDPEPKDRAELLPQEDGAPSGQNQGPGPEGEGVLGAPETELAGKGQVPHVMTTATGEAQECAAKDQDSLAGLEGGDKEGPVQGQQGAGVTVMTQGVSEEDCMKAEKLSEEAMGGDPEEEANEECPLGTGVMANGDTDGAGSLQGGVAVADEDLHPREAAGTATEEKREVLADVKTAEGKTEANKASSLSDVAGKGPRHEVDDLPGKMAAAEKVEVVEETALGRGEVAAVEMVTGTWVGAPRDPSDPGGKAPQLGQDPEGGGLDPTQGAESVGAEAGLEGCAREQELGAAKEFSLRMSPGRESEPGRESLQGVETLPAKPDCPETQEKQAVYSAERERESENADVSLSNMKA